MAGLYIHIPFCVRKCLYCDFYSLPKRPGAAAHADGGSFIAALAREMESLPEDFAPETIFIGGGTPTELSDRNFAALFDLLKRRVDLSRVTEWSCESNPGTLTREKIGIMLGAGVNRVSLGVQSFDPKTLEFLGRIHSAENAAEGFRLLRDCGMKNINLDLIYGVPGQGRGALEESLQRLVELGPEHVACYCLIFEDGTPLADLKVRGIVKEVSDDEELGQYEIVRGALGAAGFSHYEISNFAKPGFECRHNLLYWSGGEYIGLGPSAHSHWNGVRWGNVRDLAAYCRNLEAGQSTRAFEEKLDAEAKARETLVMSLRQIRGVGREEFRAATGFDYAELCRDQLTWLRREGLIDDSGDRLRLTPRGLFVSDGIFAELV